MTVSATCSLPLKRVVTITDGKRLICLEVIETRIQHIIKNTLSVCFRFALIIPLKSTRPVKRPHLNRFDAWR
jgi:hypothetical protein